MGHDNPYLKKSYRFVWVASVLSHGDVCKHNRGGTEAFDHIWRQASEHARYLVIRSGNRWLVTSMSGAKMNDQGIVEMGPYKLFTTEDAAIMYASMVASQGKEIMNLVMRQRDKLYRGLLSRRGHETWFRIESDDLTHS